MKVVNLFLILILCSLNVRQTDALIPMSVIRVISFGMDVYSFFDSILGEDEDKSTQEPIDYDRIVNRISEEIKASSETIAFKVEIQLYISDLRDVAMTINQLLAEMKNIVTAKSKEKREEYQRRFSDNYRLHETKIDRIKTLLTFSVDVPGISSTLLSLIANEFECGITRLEEFQNYYMTLVSDVVALSLLSERLATKSLYNETFASWNTSISSLFDSMEEQKSICKAKFFKLVKNDFDKINDAAHLYENNQNKYPYKSTDVLFLSGSYCVWNLKEYDNILKKKQDKQITFMVINAEENNPANKKEHYSKIASEAKFYDCLEDVDKILSYFNVLGEDLIFWLMFPQDRATESKILRHKNSTATLLDGTKYTTVFYVRAQNNDINSTLSSADFDTFFNVEDVPAEEESGLIAWLKKMFKNWEFWLVVAISFVVLICIIVAIVKFCCRCCREN